MSTSLYRHFAGDGTLLYVGVSLSWPARTKAHSKTSAWFDEVARVEIEQFSTREAALDAEREAIKREHPKFNIVHNRLTSSRPRQELDAAWMRGPDGDALLAGINGPDVIVGPALVYSEGEVSMMVAHGKFGTAGELVELKLGPLAPEPAPAWTAVCSTVLSISRAGSITMDEARKARADIVRRLQRYRRHVEAFDTDLALAIAYAARFPSEKSRRILDEVAAERGALR